MKIRPIICKAAVCISLLAAGAASAAPIVLTWTGTAGDSDLENSNNWSPVTATRPSSALGDTLQWNGTVSGNLFLTNAPGNGTAFDSNPGFYINVTAGQTGSVTLVESNTFTTRIRLNGTNSFNLASGAGAFSFGDGSGAPLPITLAGKGTGETHPFTNNSVNLVTFNSEAYYVMGGGGSHTMVFGGTGNFLLDSSFQSDNSATLGLTVSGSGVVTVIGTPVSGAPAYAGTYGTVTVNSGTLQLGGINALGSGNTLVLAGGNLDSSVPGLVNSGNNAQSWNGNFGFIGTQSLDLGFGPITLNASRIVTVNANTLTVDGAITGTGFSLTKSGAGTLVLNGSAGYTGGTIVSNGVLQVGGGSSFPNGTVAAENLSVYGTGTLDLNQNSIIVSGLNGSGIMDTVSGGTPTLTVGDQNTGGSFSGIIQNSSGSLALVQSGGLLILGGASTYSGGTAVNAGTLLVTNTTGSGTGSGAVTVASGATFGGTGIVGGSVAWQSGSMGSFTVGSPLTINATVTLSGNSLIINVPGAIPLVAGSYPLMTYNTSGSSGSFSSSGLQFSGAGVSPGTSSSVSTSGGTVTLTVVSTVNGVHATWVNNTSGNWSTAANWSSNPSVPHAPGDLATLGFGAVYTTVTLDAIESVGGIVFTNPNSFDVANAGNTLTFDNSGGGAVVSVAAGTSNLIASAVSLNDNLSVSSYPGTALLVTNTISGGSANTISFSGGGTVTLNGNNSYGPSAGSIGTTLIGSTVQLSQNTGLSAGDIAVVGGSTVRALLPITLANNIIVSNAATASLDNNGNNVQLSGAISGTGGFGKNGLGTLNLSGGNSYNGTTSISAGTVQLGNASGIPGGTGNGNVNMGTNTTLDLNGFSPTLNSINASFGSATIDTLSGGTPTLTVGASGGFGTFYGSIKNSSGSLALVMNGAGQQTLAGTNSYTGGTTITMGTLQVGAGNTNANAGLGTGPVVDNGTLAFNLVGTNSFTNAISGTGALNLNNNNLTLVLASPNTFSGYLTVNDGSLWLKKASALGTGPKEVVVDNGTVGNSQAHLDGSLGNLTTDPTIDFYLSNLGGCLFNESGNNTIQGNVYLPYGGGAAYVKVNAGFLTLAGNVSSDGNANGRTLQLGGAGNGLFSGSAYDNAQTLAGITKVDAGTWTLSGISTTIGTLTAGGGNLVLNGAWVGGPVMVNSGGTLLGTGVASNLTVNAGGIFVPGAYGSVGSFTVTNFLTLSGTMYASLNKSLGQPNTVVNIQSIGTNNVVASSGSTLVVSNLGPALVAGDTFTLFSQAVTNGNLTTVTVSPLPSGLLVTNNLALNGSISIYSTVNTTPTNLVAQLSGSQLVLSWPADHTGWHLQAQTNTLTTGLGTNWVTIVGSNTGDTYTNTINSANGTVFYRMVYP